MNLIYSYKVPYKSDELLSFANPAVSVTNAQDVSIAAIMKKNNERNCKSSLLLSVVGGVTYC